MWPLIGAWFDKTQGKGSKVFQIIILTHLLLSLYRFPIMKRQTDFITNFMRNIERTPCQYSFEDTKDHPIVNHGLQKPQKQQGPKEPAAQKTFLEQNWLERSGQSQG